jgi:predicted phage-related endonuclease
VKIIACKQGSPEWLRARLGVPTASCFDKILSPAKLAPSASQGKYRARLLAEWYLGQPLDEPESGFMQRGTQLEGEAVKWFEFTTGMDAAEVGFCLTDNGDAGASPDRLVGTDGLLEIKCPSAETHMGYLLSGFDEYVLQVQGQLWVTGRQFAYQLSYHPSIPSVLKRVERDDKTIKAIAEHVPAFAATVAAGRETLRAMTADSAATVEAFRGDDSPF